MTDDRAEDLDLPEHLSEEARDLVSGVLEDLTDAGEEPDAYLWAAVLQAAELISTADRLDAVARAADYVAQGSQGQEVLHPAVQEARQARTAAAKTITALRGKPETRHRFTSRTGAAAAAAGHRARRSRGSS